MAAGQELRLVSQPAEELDRVIDRLGPLVLERGRDHRAPPFACWIVRQTFSGLAGRGTSVTPRCDNASITALITAGGDAIVPVSPTPFTPSSLLVDGVTSRPTSISGTSVAAGTR